MKDVSDVHSTFAAFESVVYQDNGNTASGDCDALLESCAISSRFPFIPRANIDPLLKSEHPSMSTMDLNVRISNIPANQQQTIAQKVSDFFNVRLKDCKTGKCYTQISTLETHEFLVRINTVGIKNLRSTFKNNLDCIAPGVSGTLTRNISSCDSEEQKRLLDTSCQSKIDLTESLRLPVISDSSTSELIGPSESGTQVSNITVPTTAAKEDAIGDDRGRLSGSNLRSGKASEGIISNSLFVFTGNNARQAGDLNAATRILLVIKSSAELESAKFEEIRSDIVRTIQAKTYEAAIDATNKDAQGLHVKIVCRWKNPMHSHTIRRLIRETIAKRVELSKVMVFGLQVDAAGNPGTLCFQRLSNEGSRWLQHSLVRGAAYQMPIQEFVVEMGKLVKDHEAQYLRCTTLSEYIADAKAKQLLLANIHDVFQWRFPLCFSPTADVTRSEPDPSIVKSAQDTSSFHFEKPASQNATTALESHLPAPTSCALDCAVASIPNISSSQSARPERADLRTGTPQIRKSLNYQFDQVAQAPSGGGAGPACDSAAGKKGV